MAAARSAEERIDLWYQQFTHALQQTRWEWYTLNGLSNPRDTAETYVWDAQAFVEGMERRITYLEEHPAEVVKDRLDVLAEKAREALCQAPARDAVHELTPEERRIDEAIGLVTSAAYQGQLAEERFYAEQDPQSQWYREDLYHGEPGPDQVPYWNQGHDVRHQEREQGAYGTQHDGFEGEDLSGEPAPRLEVDTSDADMGTTWQQTFAQLQARLDAMEQGTPAYEQAQDHHRDEGMSY